MQRVKIDLPESFDFSTEISVRISDINYGGHLGNDTILTIMHEARLQFLKSLGYDELNLEGVSIIMGDAAIIFRGEGFYGDLLKVEVAVGDLGNSGFDLFYKMSKQEGKEIAIGKTGIVCFDYDERKVARLPEAFRERFERASS